MEDQGKTSQEHRSLRRFKTFRTATCHIGGQEYQAHTHDINETGMTLFTDTQLPKAGRFKVSLKFN